MEQCRNLNVFQFRVIFGNNNAQFIAAQIKYVFAAFYNNSFWQARFIARK